MASLIETLIDALEKENTEYEALLKLSIEKTGIIVNNDPDALNAIVEREQTIVERITQLEKKRSEATGDIAIVLNRKPQELTLNRLCELLAGQPKECEALRIVHDKLSRTMENMVRVNDSNKQLLQESLEMIEFEMNLVQSMRQAPATANYSGRQYADGAYGTSGMFDAKQ